MKGYRMYAQGVAWILCGLATLAGITLDEAIQAELVNHLDQAIGGLMFVFGLVTIIMRRITDTPPGRIGLNPLIEWLIAKIRPDRLIVIILALPLAAGLSGCQSLQTANLATLQARQEIHAAAIAHARETLREAEEWRRLAQPGP